jgi:hypothetical protein
VDKLQSALKKSESRANKATRLLREKEEKCVGEEGRGGGMNLYLPAQSKTYCFPAPFAACAPGRERLEALALESMATQVERNLELATRRALAAETEASTLRQEVQRLRREKAVC